MFNIRSLDNRDIEGMLEWMHDPEAKQIFRFPFYMQTHETVQEFIDQNKGASDAIDDKELLRKKKAVHFAIEDKFGTYLGTISLKEIDFDDCHAEYAISMRACARGTGAARKGTELILELAFFKLGLEKVYLNVLSDNVRAIKFYQKAGFVFEGAARNHIKIGNEYKTLEWYSVLKDDYLRMTGE